MKEKVKEKLRAFLPTLLDKSSMVGVIAAIFGVAVFISLGNLFDWGENHVTEADYVELEEMAEKIYENPGEMIAIIEDAPNSPVKSYFVNGNAEKKEVTLYHKNGGYVDLEFSNDLQTIEMTRDIHMESLAMLIILLVCISGLFAYLLRAILLFLWELVENLIKAVKRIRQKFFARAK